RLEGQCEQLSAALGVTETLVTQDNSRYFEPAYLQYAPPQPAATRGGAPPPPADGPAARPQPATARSPAAAGSVRRTTSRSAVRKLATRVDHESMTSRPSPRRKKGVIGPSCL